MHDPDILSGVRQLFATKNPKSIFLARQMLFSQIPASVWVERYLLDNEGNRQSLEKFPMMREIYDQLPQKLLLKCSRKTLKSTLLSNTICLNMIRWNAYKMLYVAPQEASTKYFSSNYVSPRFDSPELKKIFVKGWQKNDVYEKIFADTDSAILFKYARDDATRCRGPATDHNIHDEVQDIHFDILPIIRETMALSRFKREFFAGTPLTTDNTINELWKRSSQMEWATKCTGCNHWNMLTMENNPMKMIQPKGLSCSRCSKLLDTTQGIWVSALEDHTKKDLVMGYHLAQPILPHFNQTAKGWNEIYNKVTDGNYGAHQVYNEVFGIAYDVGSKPITQEELKNLCCLGRIRDDSSQLRILNENRHNYACTSTGVDWGVNMITSRTAVVHGGLRTDGRFEVFDAKIFNTLDYEKHIEEIAKTANATGSLVAADGGPDPIRSHKLGEQTAPDRMFIVRYGNGKLVQYFDMPNGASDWRANRYVMHRSDCLSFTFRLLKAGKILFPDWLDMETCLGDILNEFIETKEGAVESLLYSHAPNKPDDFLHALTFAVVTAYAWAGDTMLQGTSSSAPHYNAED